jgi:nitroreductase
MDLIQAIRERKSVRAFRPNPVPRETIEQLLRTALLAPSAINLQSWELTVIIGEEKDRLSRRLLKAYREKQISCSPGNVKPLPRSVTSRGAKTLQLMNPFFEEMGVDPRKFVNEGSCNFYGAPGAVILTQDDSFPAGRMVDVGIVLAYLLLAAHDLGLWTCPIGLITSYADDIKDLLNIPESKNVVVGLALGYPDWNSPINRFKSPREDLEKMVRWIE